MKEHIEREALLELYQIDGPENETGHVPLPVIRQNIMDLPAADVAEVRHGKWEQHLQSSKVAPVYTCSLCKLNVSGFEKRWIKYCPYCGARMEKEDEHEAD